MRIVTDTERKRRDAARSAAAEAAYAKIKKDLATRKAKGAAAARKRAREEEED